MVLWEILLKDQPGTVVIENYRVTGGRRNADAPMRVIGMVEMACALLDIDILKQGPSCQTAYKRLAEDPHQQSAHSHALYLYHRRLKQQ
jgi:hypothetical protein